MLPDELAGTDPNVVEEIGARILRFSIDLAREEKACGSREAALAQLGDSRRYDARLFTALTKATATTAAVPKGTQAAPATTPEPTTVKAADIRAGMVMVHDLLLTNGKVFLTKGQTISEVSAMMLEELSGLGLIAPTVEVLSPA